MENEKWSWFAGGVVLGLLMGLGIAAGYGMTQLHQARAEAEEARAMAEIHAEEAARAEAEARMHAGRALSALAREGRAYEKLEKKSQAALAETMARSLLRGLDRGTLDANELRLLQELSDRKKEKKAP